jgi:hypothetical protein
MYSNSDPPSKTFLRKAVKSRDVSEMYSSSNLHVLVSTITAVTPGTNQVRDVEGAAGVKGEAWMSCALTARVEEQ